MSKSSFKFSKAALVFTFICVLIFSAPAQVHASEPYVTNEFDLTMDVGEDDSFYMKYEIAVDFNEASHGIYCYIPLGRDFKIDRINVAGDQFETYKENGNVVIKIGDPDRLIRGAKVYTIEYRCRFFKDKNPDYDFLYWNLLSPGGWDTDIGSFTATVNMPKPFNNEYVRFTGGAAGGTELADMDVDFTGNTITARSNGPVIYGDGITCAIQLPEGYFNGAMTVDWVLALFFVCAAIAAILSFVLWFLFGRDPRVVKTVEFYPPDGMPPADAGYIVDGIVDKEDITSMIIYFADKGYLSIEEGDGRTKPIILKKLRDLPEESRTYEYTLFNGLFGKKDSVNVDELKGGFYPHYTAAIGQLYAYFNKPSNRVFTMSSLIARIAGIILMAAPMVLYAVIVYNLSANVADVVFMAPFAIFAVVGLIVEIFTFDKKYSMNKVKRRAVMIIAGIVAFIACAGFVALGAQLYGLRNAALAAVLCTLISFVFTALMRKRTKKGADLLGKLLGFKEFISRAELDRLKSLVVENPSYFYNILPYAYVFGLSKKWAKNFEGIELEPPGWYSGGGYVGAFNTVLFMNSFGRAASAMERGLSIPANSGGGSGGGGFGGGGFGGSSTGGGSGGFGGGRW